MSSLPDPESFRAALLAFVNETLPRLDHKQGPPGELDPATPETPLFTTGRLDSLSILHLIAAIENLTGQPVPDAMVSMKHFQSIETLTAAFCHASSAT